MATKRGGTEVLEAFNDCVTSRSDEVAGVHEGNQTAEETSQRVLGADITQAGHRHQGP